MARRTNGRVPADPKATPADQKPTLAIVLSDEDADLLPPSAPSETPQQVGDYRVIAYAGPSGLDLDPIITGIGEQRTPQPHKAGAVARIVAQIYDECREGFRPPPAESDDLWTADRPLPVDNPCNAYPAERRAALRQCLQNATDNARDALIRRKSIRRRPRTRRRP